MDLHEEDRPQPVMPAEPQEPPNPDVRNATATVPPIAPLLRIPLARPVSLDALSVSPPAALPLSFDAAYVNRFGGQITAGAARQSRWSAFFQLILLAVVTILAAVVTEMHLRLPDERWAGLLATFVAGTIAVFTAMLLTRASGQRLATIGMTTHHLGLEIGIGLLCAVLVFAGLFVGSAVLVQFRPEMMNQSNEAREAIRTTLPPLSFRMTLLTVAFVALWEETIFRGFLLTRLYAILRRWWLVVPLGAVLFALPHCYQGALAMTIVGCLGLFMGIVFLWTRSLVPVMVLHAIFDFVMFMLLQHMPAMVKIPAFCVFK
jgi:membrane protease YdiL (CAAX protease family)